MSVEEATFWEPYYQQGTLRWDLGQAAPPLVELLQAAKPKPGRAAVLGCGRGYDALLFADQGFEVVGFDFAPSAIAAATALAQAAGSSAQFLQRDIFELIPEFENQFDYVVEHTCFCAIAPEKRPDYVRLVRTLLRPQGELLGLFFTHQRPGGPPFGVTSEEIQQYFRADFEILSLTPNLNSIPARQGEEHIGQFRLKPLESI
ncbi:methyltransferase domain-containing protein [Leptolyngbya sp. FACHB-261]|uniref:methyltransferase domain-containing protein n=1 Tax=Leptolyngbya sp. FACHB-261 TaxID=2692806 RepID=UPI0016899F34|nr:methyltransferase domain-containing protein [Leptolyngbya sp. FACHB-261]MBD2103256.1 methyltransferase domain-containing protein [Leptolyngbya sp. FACHB-261]